MQSLEKRVVALESLILSFVVFMGSFAVLFNYTGCSGYKLVLILALALGSYVALFFNFFRVVHNLFRQTSFRFSINIDRYVDKNECRLNHIMIILLAIIGVLTLKVLGYGYIELFLALVVDAVCLLPGHYIKTKISKKSKKR